MKHIPLHTHSIEVEFTAKGFLLLRATIPLKLKMPFKISDWYKKTKEAVANSHQIPLSQVKGKSKKIESKNFNRILYEFAGGMAMDLPDDCSSYDYEIILHYLEGVKMSLSRS